MASRGTLDALIVPVSQAFRVVGDLLAVDDGAELLAKLGYKVPGGSDLPQLFVDLATSIGSLTTSLNAVLDAYEDGSYDQPSFLPKTLNLAKSIADVVTAAKGLADRADTAFAGANDFLANGKLDELPQRLVDYLIVTYLAREFPAVVGSFELVGLTSETFVEEGQYNPDFYLVEVHWDRFALIVSNPRELFVREYAWGTADFDSAKFLNRLQGLLWLVGLPSRYRHVAEPEIAVAVSELEVPLFAGAIATPADGLAGIELGLRLRRSDPGADADDVGLAITPYAEGSFELTIDIAEGWTLTADAHLDAEGLRISVRPQSGVQIEAAIALAAALGLTLRRDGSVLGPLVVFGNDDGTRLQIGEISQRVFASLATDKPADVGAEFSIKEGALVVQAGEGDGFLKNILPKEPLIFGFDITIGFSTTRGLYFTGGAELDYTFHLDAQIGPIFINTIDLGLKVAPTRIGLIVSATGGLELGPVVAVVQKIGVEGRLEPGKTGNLGNADFSLAFKPPTGIGLSIDTPAIKAAGFLSIDTERGRYIGALELSVLGKFDLACIAVITTKMPDGSEGFSLLFIISIVFPVPIPLSYNFYFAGAGGLLGLNRSINLDRLRDGLRAGSADSILFPTDIIRRIDAIVRDIEEVFPPLANHFLVGPMALITWSSPPIISLKLGIIIEIGTPFRIAILGVLRAALPDPDEAVLDLKVAFLGTIDIGAGLLAFDASIYDSYIGYDSFKLTFEGDIAVRLSWGPQKDFVTTVGGFHPLFKPAAFLKLPLMRRITLSLLKDNPRLSLSAYFALTTNTVQFGSKLSFYFSVSSFTIEGDFGFDVLFQFSPFHVDAHCYARLAVRSGGSDLLSINLDFQLLGPTPWIATGSAKFKVLLFSVSAHFEKRFGEDVQTTIPDVAVLPLVLDELKRDANWRSELVAGVSTLVTIKPTSVPAGTVLLDAGGRLTVSQRILPLETDFTLFGTSRPSDAERVRVSELRIGSAAASLSPVLEPFAPAAFRAMSDKEKLKAAAYEPRPSGVQATGDQQLRTDYILGRPVAYEVLVSDTAAGAAESRMPAVPEPRSVFERLVPGGATGRSPLSKTRARAAERGSVVDAGAIRDRFAVTRADDLAPLDDQGNAVDPERTEQGRPVYADGVLVSRDDAEARLARLKTGARGTLAIVPEAQLAA